jgi:hypothetical protein
MKPSPSYARTLTWPRIVVLMAASLSLAASTSLPPSEVIIREEGEHRRITANGIPNHEPGDFPNPRNPNRISAQQYDYRVPLHPQLAASPVPFHMQPFGIAVNGIVFDPFAAEWWQGNPSSGWQYEPQGGAIDLGLDASNAHVQPNGAYHYHGIPHGLIAKLSADRERITLVGWAADGFPIYGQWGHADAKDASSPLKKLTSSYGIREGARPPSSPGGKYDGSFVQDYLFIEGKGDLDASNGRFAITPEYPEGIYHYVLTEAYPFIPRQFAGTPDASFQRRGPPGGGGFGPPGRRGGPGGRPPPPPRGFFPPPF